MNVIYHSRRKKGGIRCQTEICQHQTRDGLGIDESKHPHAYKDAPYKHKSLMAHPPAQSLGEEEKWDFYDSVNRACKSKGCVGTTDFQQQVGEKSWPHS